MSPANKMLPPGEQAAVLSASAGILCTGDEYTGPDGLRCCSYCHGHREMRVRLLGRERIVPVLCNCQVEERDKREREMKLRDFQLKRERLREEGLEDKGYYEYCFAKDNKRNPQMKHAYTYVENWDRMKAEGKGLLIWGGTGTGKSFMAGCIANALIDQCVPVMMTNFARILNKITGTFGDERNQIISRMNHNSLLIIDDLGIERNTDFAMEQIFNVIDSRYRSRKPMIICTNLQLSELKNPQDVDHERIYSRILEHSICIKCNGINFREENAKKTMEEAVKVFR